MKFKAKGKAVPSTKQFPFLELPRELRDKIYKLAATTPSPCGHPDHVKNILVHEMRFDQPGSPQLRPVKYEPALARTCRQVRAELLPLFYRINSFHFCIDTFTDANFCKWAASLKPEHAKAIPHLYLSVVGVPYWESPRRLLEAKAKAFSPDVRIRCGGPTMAAFAFHQAWKTGESLRKAGLSWDQVDEALALVETTLEAAGFDGEWADLDESDFSDEVIYEQLWGLTNGNGPDDDDADADADGDADSDADITMNDIAQSVGPEGEVEQGNGA